MKKLLLTIFVLAAASLLRAQDANLEAQIKEVLAIIDQQSPVLIQGQEELGVVKQELEERIIVLKYHQGNKEVSAACSTAVKKAEDLHTSVSMKVKDFESVWYAQMRNVINIYTKYGESVESGNRSTSLDNFVNAHSDYLDLMEYLKSDLIGVYGDISYIKSKI